MSVFKIVMLGIFILGMSVLLMGAGIAIAWMAIEDTTLGRAIDEIMAEHIERWRHGKTD